MSQVGTTVVYTDDTILAMQWHPDGNRLYWLTDKSLNEWPSKKRYPIPKTPSGLQALGHTRMAANASGSQMLVTARYMDSYFLFDTRSNKMLAVRGPTINVWWIGDKLAKIVPTIRNEAWEGPEVLLFEGKRRALPPEWMFGAADHTVLFAKGRAGYEAPIALFRMDLKTLKVSRFRTHREKFYTEYIEQDSLAWNEALQIAAIGITADTGATIATPLMSLKGRTQSFDFGFHYFMGAPMWVENRVLFSTCEFREEQSKTANHGADIYRIRLYDPATRKFDDIETIDNHWIWQHGSEEDESPRRSEQPKLELAVATRDGTRLAYVRTTLGTSEVIVRPLVGRG